MIFALHRQIGERFGIRLSFSTVPDDFAATVKAARKRLKAEGIADDGLPIFGRHINPDLNHIAPDCFFATCGFADDGLVTTNTARLYRFEAPQTIRWLFESLRLYFDDPERHAFDCSCLVTGDDPRLDRRVTSLLRFGTAWVHPRLQGRGISRRLVALNRAKAFEALGDHLGFGTTLASTDGSWTGTDPAGMAVLYPGKIDDPHVIPVPQQIRVWTQQSSDAVVRALIEADARKALDEINPAAQSGRT